MQIVVPLREHRAASRRYGERHQHCPALNHMCNQSKLTARRQVQVLYIYSREIYTIIYYIWHTRASWDTSRVRAQCLPLFLQGGWGGQLGLLGRAAPIVFQLLIRGMSLLVLARIGVRVTLPGRRRICGSIVFGQNALMPMVQGLEGRPLWGRTVYTALHGAHLSSVPSGDQSANPASVPGRSGL